MPLYQKPSLQRFGSFRELTQLGLHNNTDGASFFGIGSPGCETFGIELGCPDGPTAS